MMMKLNYVFRKHQQISISNCYGSAFIFQVHAFIFNSIYICSQSLQGKSLECLHELVQEVVEESWTAL